MNEKRLSWYNCIKYDMALGDQARVFRDTFEQESLPNISRFGFIKKSLWDMQVGLVNEESCEFLAAAEELYADPENTRRREELVKELADVVFVCYQFAAAFNIDLDKAMTLVFESNMSKLDEHGKPIFRPDGKVLKGPKYIEPDLSDCVPQPHFYYDTHGK
jgi:NTP pyrophosphatase (non-canonical NTP hydrolase)